MRFDIARFNDPIVQLATIGNRQLAIDNTMHGFDDIKESALMALDTLRANKLRSSLTILGVSVGVVTVIFMVSIIQGLNRAFAEQIESLGSNTIFVSKFEPSFGRPPGPEEIHRKDLTMDDAEALRREAPSIAGVSPIHRMIAATVRYQDKQTDTPILFGVTPYYEFVQSQYVASGRFIGDIDMQDRSNVCVIGVDVMRALFPYENAVDKEIRINGNPYRVIGVMEPLGNFFGQSRDNSIFMPISTFDKYYPDRPFPEVVFFIIVRPQSRAYVKSAMDEMTDILRRRRRVPARRAQQFRNLVAGLIAGYLQPTYRCHGAGADGHFFCGADDWRNRRDEYHAGLSDGTNERDRSAQSRGRHQIQYPVAVSDRSCGVDGDRWLAGLVVGEVASLLMNTLFAVARLSFRCGQSRWA